MSGKENNLNNERHMKKNRAMEVALNSFKKNKTALIVVPIIIAINFAMMALYNMTAEPIIYSSIIAIVLLIIFFCIDFIKEKSNAKRRENDALRILEEVADIPDGCSLEEKDYHQMLKILSDEIEKIRTKSNLEQREMIDYYTSWVHQIKTPIAVMKLRLEEDTDENRALSAELFRIEQYVDMVLQYIRLGTEGNDLLIKETEVDDIIKESVRKFAPSFILKKIKLDYRQIDHKIITDSKWFSCIIDQLISNALKYTKTGTISIYETKGFLVIEDTGIGISPEDRARIFEKGFTGINGRLGEKSSGLGLYLAKSAAEKLAIKIDVESTPGEGSRFFVELKTTSSK